MPIVPFRQLGSKGILLDPSPYQLTLDCWSGGSNVRFDAQKAMRAPVWRSVVPGTTSTSLPHSPVYVFSFLPANGFDQVMTADSVGHVTAITGGSMADVTPTAFTSYEEVSQAYTSTFLGQVGYLNNPQGHPLYYTGSSSNFAVIPAWDTSWYCRSLRAFGDYLMALNVTKAGIAYPNMVKWSDLALTGAPPASWDADDLTTSAGENPLEQLETPIVDGLPLGSAFVVYSEDQIWLVQQTGTQAVFSFTQIFSEGGMIAPNCAVEVGGKHYVFGVSDIYVHDGVSKNSIATQRVQQWIFTNRIATKSEQFFVHHMPKYKEIVFGFVSKDNAAFWNQSSGVDSNGNPAWGCNRAAVYNYELDVWSLLDLPGIVGMATVNLTTSPTFGECGTTTFGTSGGTYADLLNGQEHQEVAANQAVPLNPGSTGSGPSTGSQILAYDFIDKGQLSYPMDQTSNAPAVLIRTGIDLDEQGGDLTTYKTVRRVYPQVNAFQGPNSLIVPVEVIMGGQLYPGQTPSYIGPIAFDPTQQYKVDMRKGGRYISMQFTIGAPADFEISGFDLDIVSSGKR